MDQAAPAVTAAPQPQDPKRLVLKNTAVLLLGQLLGAPLTMVVAAVMGRYLGADRYGEIYIVTAMVQFGFIFVDWGQGNLLSGEIPRDRSRAGELLGTSLVWRLLASLVVYGILATWTALEVNSPPQAQMVLFLLAVQYLIITITTASLEAIRGLERTDISAYQNVLQPILSVALIVPVLKYFHGGVREALLAQNTVLALMLAYVWRARRQVGIRPLGFRMSTLKGFFKPGSAFLLFNLAMALQPVVDAKMLQYLHVPLDVAGWNGAARKLLGPLVLPAAVLIGALYPTLSRLHIQDPGAFSSTLRSAVRGTLILAFPIGLGCWLFADLGVMLFGEEKYGGSQMNLIFLAPYVFFMYFSMPLGAAILAAQQQRAWAAIQSICVIVSVVLDPLLIPWFQNHWGNGGLGVCVAAVVSEVFMVAGGVYLVPRGTFDRGFTLALLRCLAAGAAMVGVGLLFRHLHLSTLLAAPVAVVAYFIALWAVGGLGGEQLAGLKASIGKKLSKR